MLSSEFNDVGQLFTVNIIWVRGMLCDTADESIIIRSSHAEYVHPAQQRALFMSNQQLQVQNGSTLRLGGRILLFGLSRVHKSVAEMTKSARVVLHLVTWNGGRWCIYGQFFCPC